MPEKKVMFVPLEKALSKKKAEQKDEVPVPEVKEVKTPPTSEGIVEVQAKDESVEPVAVPSVEIPIEKAPLENSKADPNKSGKLTILVAEDEKPLSRALELKLTNQGYNVLTVFDGEEAVEKLKNNKVDLAILDIVMPKLDGFGVLAKIKEFNIKTLSVVISNLSQDEDKAKALSLGASEYFIKSDIPISDIVSYITKTLNA
ncbi:MAG: response regulator [Candidatus Dojkabacteria bacterium]